VVAIGGDRTELKAVERLDLAMDSPADYFDEDEAVFPCKGCGEILEEGKAFELGEIHFLLQSTSRAVLCEHSRHEYSEHSWRTSLLL
jgi:hypothetical protein